jgi:uncharacterized membrane protein YhaH (DUF805 family)
MREIVEFIFPRRLHRLAYFLRGTTVEIITSYLSTYGFADGFRFWWIPFVVLSVYEAFFIVLPRIRDVEMSGWWLLACLVPFVGAALGIILLFRRPVLLPHSKPKASDSVGYQQIAFPSGIS